MGIFDKLKKDVVKAVDEHGDQIGKGIDQVAGMADKKTGGKHDGQIATGAAKAKDALDSLDGKDDDIADGPHKAPPKS